MADGKNSVKIEVQLGYHPADLAKAHLAAAASRMEFEDFVVLATHEKATQIVNNQVQASEGLTVQPLYHQDGVFSVF